jgi:hypothetical protein
VYGSRGQSCAVSEQRDSDEQIRSENG